MRQEKAINLEKASDIKNKKRRTDAAISTADADTTITANPFP